MGDGKYDVDAAEVRTQTRAQAPSQQTFHQGPRTHSNVSIHGLTFRESCDSDDHSNSRADAFIMDVSGSMGNTPRELVTQTLPTYMRLVLPYEPDVQILFGAFQDYTDGDGEKACQIGQWESDDAKADACLTSLSLNGGGRPHEDIAIAMYVMARHTKIDCWTKRGKKGYLYLTTDDTMRPMVEARVVNALFGRTVLEEDIPTAVIIAELTQRYHVFVLIPDPGRVGYGGEGTNVLDCYQAHFGHHVIVQGASVDAAVVAAMLSALTEGHLPNLKAVDRELETRLQMSKPIRERVLTALRPYAESIQTA